MLRLLLTLFSKIDGLKATMWILPMLQRICASCLHTLIWLEAWNALDEEVYIAYIHPYKDFPNQVGDIDTSSVENQVAIQVFAPDLVPNHIPSDPQVGVHIGNLVTSNLIPVYGSYL